MDLLSMLFDLCSSVFVFVIGAVVLGYILYPLATFVSKTLHRFTKFTHETIWNISCLITACISIGISFLIIQWAFSYLTTLTSSIFDLFFNGDIERKISEFIEPVSKRFGVDYKAISDYIKSNLGSFGYSNKLDLKELCVESFHACLIGLMVFIASIHIIRDWNKWQRRIIGLEIIFSNQAKKIDYFCNDFSSSVKKWIVGQIIVASILSAYYALGFMLIKLPNAIILGLIFGFSCFIPYFGDIISIIAVAYTLLNAVNQLILIIAIVIISIIGHVIGSHVLTPWIIGSHTGLHPLQIILGFVIYSKLFGVWGVILNIPISLFFNALFKTIFIKQDDEEI